LGHLFHIGRKTAEPPYRIFIPIRTDGDPMFAASDIDTCRIGMDDLQRLPIQRFPAWLFGLVCGLLSAHEFSCSIESGLGSARFRSILKDSSTGSDPCPKTSIATNAWDRMRKRGHAFQWVCKHQFLNGLSLPNLFSFWQTCQV
jgi:hypothetical protein